MNLNPLQAEIKSSSENFWRVLSFMKAQYISAPFGYNNEASFQRIMEAKNWSFGKCSKITVTGNGGSFGVEVNYEELYVAIAKSVYSARDFWVGIDVMYFSKEWPSCCFISEFVIYSYSNWRITIQSKDDKTEITNNGVCVKHNLAVSHSTYVEEIKKEKTYILPAIESESIFNKTKLLYDDGGVSERWTFIDRVTGYGVKVDDNAYTLISGDRFKIADYFYVPDVLRQLNNLKDNSSLSLGQLCWQYHLMSLAKDKISIGDRVKFEDAPYELLSFISTYANDFVRKFE